MVFEKQFILQFGKPTEGSNTNTTIAEPSSTATTGGFITTGGFSGTSSSGASFGSLAKTNQPPTTFCFSSTPTTVATGGGTPPTSTTTGFGAPTAVNTNTASGFGCSTVKFAPSFNIGNNSNIGEYISFTGPVSYELITKSGKVHDIDIEVYENDELFTKISTNRILLAGLSTQLDDMVGDCKHSGDRFTLVVKKETFELDIGKFNVLVLKYLFLSITSGTVRLHIDHSFPLLMIFNHLKMNTPYQTLRNLLQNSFTQQTNAQKFVKYFNNFFKQGYEIDGNLLSLFSSAFDVLTVGIDSINNQVAVGELHNNLLEIYLKGSKIATLRTIFHMLDVWMESNSNKDPMQAASLLDVIPVSTPKDCAQMIAILSCYPSRFQFVNAMSPQHRLKLIHKYSLLLSQ